MAPTSMNPKPTEGMIFVSRTSLSKPAARPTGVLKSFYTYKDKISCELSFMRIFPAPNFPPPLLFEPKPTKIIKFWPQEPIIFGYRPSRSRRFSHSAPQAFLGHFHFSIPTHLGLKFDV